MLVISMMKTMDDDEDDYDYYDCYYGAPPVQITTRPMKGEQTMMKKI